MTSEETAAILHNININFNTRLDNNVRIIYITITLNSEHNVKFQVTEDNLKNSMFALLQIIESSLRRLYKNMTIDQCIKSVQRDIELGSTYL